MQRPVSSSACTPSTSYSIPSCTAGSLRISSSRRHCTRSSVCPTHTAQFASPAFSLPNRPARRKGHTVRVWAAADTEFRYLPLELPPPVNSRVSKSAFIKSSNTVRECPPSNRAEFAVIGRSNVGKSSLINCLTGNDKLAKVSKTPGMTKLINHFLINDSWYLVDLPGYGFAKTASKDSRSEWLNFTKDFFINREGLAHVLLLVDGSLPPQQVDVDCVNWLAECEVPFAIIFTKMDQRKKGTPSPSQNVRAFKKMLVQTFEELPWCFETSGRTGMGKSELLGYIASVNEMFRRTGGQ